MVQIGLEFFLSTLILDLLALASIAAGITWLYCQEDPVLIYVYVCVELICILLYMCAYVHIDISARSGQMSIPVVFLYCSFIFCCCCFWKQHLLLNLELTNSARLAGPEAPGITLSLTPYL